MDSLENIILCLIFTNTKNCIVDCHVRHIIHSKLRLILMILF